MKWNVSGDLRIHIAHCSSADTWPTDLACWLSPRELKELQRFRSPARCDDWLRGRWCGKELLRERSQGNVVAGEWEILSRHKARGCRPRVFKDRVKQCKGFSLSHSRNFAVAALLDDSTKRVGVDVVDERRLPRSFTTTWFSTSERELLQYTELPVAAAWAIKEAVFKACNDGEAFQPNRIRLLEIDDRRCRVAYEVGSTLVEATLTPLTGAWLATALYPYTPRK